MALNIVWPPSLMERVKGRNNLEETLCFQQLEGLTDLCSRYRDRLMGTGSVGYDRMVMLWGWTRNLQRSFEDEYRASNPFSKALLRGLVDRFYPITMAEVDRAFKPYKGLGFAKERVEEDRQTFHAFYDTWLSIPSSPPPHACAS